MRSPSEVGRGDENGAVGCGKDALLLGVAVAADAGDTGWVGTGFGVDN